MPETRLVESDPGGRNILAFIVQLLELDWWNVPDRVEEPAVVEPVDPLERRELDFFEAPPRAAAVGDLGLEQPDDRFGQGVVIGIPHTATEGSTPASAFAERIQGLQLDPCS